MLFNSDNLVIESYRGYLWALAHAQLQHRYQDRLEASDIVQRTFLRAHEGLPEFRGETPQAVAAWLREILKNTLADEIRNLHRGKRDISREQSIAAEVDRSVAGLENWLAADQTSPSLAAERNEQLVLLANCLIALPADQRDVVIRKHLRGETLEEIAKDTNRSFPSVAGLLRRGLATLRQAMNPLQSQPEA
jgi:RNA polymerase sigma-70 factor (ECF subfamily)